MKSSQTVASQLLIICILGLSCAQSDASDVGVLTYRIDASGVRVLETTSAGDIYPATGTRSYDNFYSPAGNPPGQTLLTGEIAIGDFEYGDDVGLRDWMPSKVSDIGWTIYNGSASGSLTSFGMSLRLYDSSLNLLATDSAFYGGYVFPPGTGARVRSTNGFYSSRNIATQQAMYISVDFYSPTGVQVEDIGVLYGGPITFGNSSQFARNMTTGQLIDLGVDPQANLGFFIDTIVPAPSSAGLYAGTSLFALRRRREAKATA